MDFTTFCYLQSNEYSEAKSSIDTRICVESNGQPKVMLNISKSSKSLIFVSFIFSGMVFWLGSHYLSDALTHFSSAVNLQRSVAPEKTLFEVSRSLDQQRSSVQQVLIESRQFDQDRVILSEFSNNTKTLFDEVRTELLNINAEGKNKLHHRYGKDSLKALVEEFDDSFKRLSITNAVLRRQVYRPLQARDEGIRMKLFDAYSNLINLVGEIRKANHGMPGKDYIDVLSAHDYKNVIWELNESIRQISTLVEAYLLKIQNSTVENLNKENLELRVLQQHNRANQALGYLVKLSKENASDNVSTDTLLEMNNQYYNNFRVQAEEILLKDVDDMNAIENLERWKNLSGQTTDMVRHLIDAALENTTSKAESIRMGARIDLLMSLLIVLFCVLMGIVTHRIARRVQHQADHDQLTDLPNRRYFQDDLDDLMRKTNVSRNEKLVLLTLDLNGFKAINDTLGHIAGDQLLIQVSERLRNVADDTKAMARMGGDEFAIAYKFYREDEPYQFACELKEAFTPSFYLDDSLAEMDTSIGYSVYPDDAGSVMELQKTSDFAMYSAKQSGKKAIRSFDRSVANEFQKRATIERDLPFAIDKNELELYYQPQISLIHDEVFSVEALIRWNHPIKGLVSPIEFVGIAEDCGLMPALGHWVLDEACRQAAIWNNTENLSIRVAVNVSVHQISQAEFVNDVLTAIERYNLAPHFLELEITESVVMSDIDWIVDSLNSLKEHGIKIALDDFGTGYSSLNQLQALPLDTLKIDRSFISRIDDDYVSSKSITATIASIAEIYGLETVAEGIETEKQLAEVRRLGISVAQGYYYSKPVARDEVASVIADIDRLAAVNISKAA